MRFNRIQASNIPLLQFGGGGGGSSGSVSDTKTRFTVRRKKQKKGISKKSNARDEVQYKITRKRIKRKLNKIKGKRNKLQSKKFNVHTKRFSRPTASILLQNNKRRTTRSRNIKQKSKNRNIFST